ncbi:hypothetical protein [Lentzea guizhouensis]|uniref:hypothetical protein n=1 Tax=Lentzea guizhouensis TaxID=1586287 RepID=UPI001474800A|nr:hypothetical protein [Lentzea guizhouensis]
MAIRVDDSAEKIMSVYDEASDLSGFASLRPAPHRVWDAKTWLNGPDLRIKLLQVRTR